MIKVGITGGIGAGKSFICNIFKCMGISVYNADMRAKWLTQNNPEIIEAIKTNFGTTIYTNNNQLDRIALAKIVFNDTNKLQILNSIIHPAVKIDSENWFNKQTENKGYALKEAALLFETETYKALDKTIVITAPRELRIKRVMKRDNATRLEVLARMEKQMSDSEKIKLADFVIVNNESQAIIPQIWKIHQQLSKN